MNEAAAGQFNRQGIIFSPHFSQCSAAWPFVIFKCGAVGLCQRPWSRTLSSECLYRRPAAGRRAGQEPAGEEPGAGAGTSANVLHQPGAVAGDRGRDSHLHQEEGQQDNNKKKNILLQGQHSFMSLGLISSLWNLKHLNRRSCILSQTFEKKKTLVQVPKSQRPSSAGLKFV